MNFDSVKKDMKKLVKVRINHFLLVKPLSFPSHHLHVHIHILLIALANYHCMRIVELIHEGFLMFEFEVKSECNLSGVDSFAMRTLRIKL